MPLQVDCAKSHPGNAELLGIVLTGLWRPHLYWRMIGALDTKVEQETFSMDLLAEGLFRTARVARVRFTARSQQAELSLFWIEGYGGGLFLPFRDATCSRGTYGGGRYLYDSIKGTDLGVGIDEIVPDFNYGYNPSCAYNIRWVCPLSPRENSLPFTMEAGEKVFWTGHVQPERSIILRISKGVFMRIVVFGTGAVGGYFGGRLAQAGEEVIFIARGEHLRALRSHGLRVDSQKGDFVIHPVQATDDPAGVSAVDAVLVGVKAWQVPEAAEAMRPLVGPDTFVVPLQNGVEAPAQLAEVLGAEHVLGGLCRIISFITGPGHIRHAGAEPYIAFGELNNRPSERAERLRQAFERATGLTVEIPPDIQAALWGKFLFIASFSGVGAVTRAPAGVLRSVPEARRLLEQAMQEIINVASAYEITLPDDIVGKTMAFVDGLPPGGTASMQRDIIEGRPSELDSQNGAVVRLGQEVGVATPLHSFIYHSLLPLELQARGQVQF